MFYLNKILKFSLEGKFLQNVLLPYFHKLVSRAQKLPKMTGTCHSSHFELFLLNFTYFFCLSLCVSLCLSLSLSLYIYIYIMYIYIYIMYIHIHIYYICMYICIYQAHIHVLKVKPTITRYVKYFVPGISTSKYLFKEIESLNNNAPARSTSFEQMLVG